MLDKHKELVDRLIGRAEAAEKANAERRPLVERFSLLREAALVITELSESNDTSSE
jgi:hypothetical protein